jgi:hypothetical protein
MLLSISSCAQLVILFVLSRIILRHLFSPVEYFTRNIRFWLPRPEYLPPEPTPKKNSKKYSKKKPANTKKGTVNLLSRNLPNDGTIRKLQGYTAIDWRFSMVLSGVVLFVTSETMSCLFPEERKWLSLDISTILLGSAAYGCIDFLLMDLLKSDKEVWWNHFSVYATATFCAFLVCNAPLAVFDFRFKHAFRAGNHQYTILVHQLGLNHTKGPASTASTASVSAATATATATPEEESTLTVQTLLFTFLIANLAGFLTSLLLKPARMLAETYVHLTDHSYTPSLWSRLLTHLDFFYPVLMIACWVPVLTSDFFTAQGLLHCNQHSVLRDCTATQVAQVAQENQQDGETVTPGAADGVVGNADSAGNHWNLYLNGVGITETTWCSIRLSIVLVGLCLKVLTGRRNIQAYLDRAHFQFDTFMASSGTATMERVVDVLQYRIRVICPNMLALFAPYGFPLCLSMILKKIKRVEFVPQTCNALVGGLQYLGWSSVGGSGGNGTVGGGGGGGGAGEESAINLSDTGIGRLLLGDDGKQSVLWFGTMSATGKTLLLIYLEQILSFFLFWSLVSSFIMMSFYIISANERLEGVFNKPVSFVAEQIKALGADVANQPKVNEEKVKGNKGNKKKKRN